jgi:hypothetical protein
MSQDVCPVTRAGAIVEPASTWGDPAVRSELRRKLSPMAPNMAANPERCQQKNPATGPSVV